MYSFSLKLLLIISCGYMIHAFPDNNLKKNSPNPNDGKVGADDVLAFTANLMKNLHHSTKDDENLIFSPVSIYGALCLVHLAAAGSTRKEIGTILGSPEDSNGFEKFHANVGAILESIQSRTERPVAEVRIANAVFLRKDLQVKESYSNQSKSFYKSDVVNVDFTQKDGAFGIINKWVSENTNGRIPKLYKEPLDPDTISLLASSLYFNGRWTEHFYSARTKQGKFFTGVEEIDVPLMNNDDTVPYFNDTELKMEAITLDFDGRDFSLNVILPHADQTLKNLTEHLKPNHLKKIFTEENYVSVDYKIPKVKFSSDISLTKVLTDLGMQQAFTGANFSNMIESVPIKIADVKHAAEIELDEDGVKASAITAIQLIPLSGKVVIDPIKFYVNRPFICVIYHRPTSTPLFTAYVHKPI